MTKNTVSQLRVLDAEILHHVIERGKLWEKRKRLVNLLGESAELSDYHSELKEWLGEMTTTQSKGDQP